VIPHSATPSPAPGKSPRSGKKTQDQSSKTPPSSGSNQNSSNRNSSGERINSGDKREGKGLTAASAWLVAPLVEKLSSQVQGRVLRHAGTVVCVNQLVPYAVYFLYLLIVIKILPHSIILQEVCWKRHCGPRILQRSWLELDSSPISRSWP
jgi:hypothetical protein